MRRYVVGYRRYTLLCGKLRRTEVVFARKSLLGIAGLVVFCGCRTHILHGGKFFSHKVGLYLESEDGIKWSDPKIAYFEVDKYIEQPPAPKHLSKYGRFERPQVLMRDGKPAYLFTTSQGGKYMNSTAFVFEVS